MRRSDALAAGAAAAVALVAARAYAQSTFTLRVGGATADTSAQAYYAESAGFFKEARLEVERAVLGHAGQRVGGQVHHPDVPPTAHLPPRERDGLSVG